MVSFWKGIRAASRFQLLIKKTLKCWFLFSRICELLEFIKGFWEGNLSFWSTSTKVNESDGTKRLALIESEQKLSLLDLTFLRRIWIRGLHITLIVAKYSQNLIDDPIFNRIFPSCFLSPQFLFYFSQLLLVDAFCKAMFPLDLNLPQPSRKLLWLSVVTVT